MIGWPVAGSTIGRPLASRRGRGWPGTEVSGLSWPGMLGTTPGPAAFQDPYAALAKLAPTVGGSNGATSADVVASDPRAVGAPGGAAVRDPFDPMYWQLSQLPPSHAANPGAAGTIRGKFLSIWR